MSTGRLGAYTIFLANAGVCETEIKTQQAKIGRILDRVYRLLHQRLHPALVEPKALKQKLKNIDEKAAARHEHIGITTINELYQLETTYFSDGQNKLVAMVHIPLYQLSTLMSLWEYIPTPAKTLLKTTSGRGKAFHFAPEKQFLARNSESYYREMSQEDLSRCHKTGTSYICDHVAVLDRLDNSSCVNSLFTGDNDGIKGTCSVHIMNKDKPHVTQIDAHRFLAYLPEETKIDIVCETYRMSDTMTKTMRGFAMVTVPDGCTGKTPHTQFHSVGNLGTFHAFVSVESEFNVSEALRHINPAEMERVFDRMDEDQVAKISPVSYTHLTLPTKA